MITMVLPAANARTGKGEAGPASQKETEKVDNGV
jgi:hypothetical protein